MITLRFKWLKIVTIYSFLAIIAATSLMAQEPDPEEAKEKSIVEKFVVVLDKNPRRGTALDKVYGYHVERGSLEGLIRGYRDKAKNTKTAESGSTWMIVGLLESLRGQDATAVAAFEQAEKLSSDNYLASYYLGQSLVLVGQPDKAAEAFERSIQRKPAQADLLDVYQALGRVYQRAQKTDKALEVWNRLEKQFPNDARVQEQIATTLLEESEFAAALPRYEALSKNTKDKYRQSLFQMESAEIKVRLGKSDEAIKEFERLLSQLLPENWLYREVRRRIEAIYLRTDDQAGLIAYYEGWISKKPDDLEAISRLSRLLAGFGRGPEAQKWLENGIKVAPKKKELRNALISQLVYEQKYVEAIAQYEQLDKNDPNNPDTLREWGRLVLKDTSRDEATRKQAAAALWKRLTVAKPKDPLTASQVGELFRQAEITEEALALYKKAIALAPDQAQYREYLGEYYHSLKRKDEALATWRAIAEGKQKNAANVARLAEVFASFGYLAEAVETNAEACKLDPKDFSLQVKRVDLLAQAEKHEEAMEQLAIVKKLAANDEENEAWLQRELRELQALDKLKDRITELVKDTESTDADRWFWLARAYESERQLKEAAVAVAKASTLSPQSVPILTASARIYEAQNNFLAAVEINTKLAQIDRRYRTEYLKQVATLEQRLGRRAKAIQAGRDLIAAAPGNPELYEFFSQLCFQLGETEEGLTALRRSVRVNPTDPKGLLLLASALSEQFRTSESIELYWRAFDKAASLDDRLGIVPKLTELYLQTNQLDRLIERLERQRREPNQQREMTICLAQAYQSAGDDGNARQELEKLMTEDTRDTQLLTQLTKLCESDGDFDAAIKFQQQLLKAAPGKDSTMRLAQLLMKSGEMDEATALLNQASLEEKDPETLLKSVDSLLNQGNFAQAQTVIEKLIRDQPTNWEIIYREAVALAKTKEKAAEAKSRFEAILALKLNDDELSQTGKNLLKKSQGRTRTPMAQARNFNPMMQRAQSSWQIRQSVGLDNQNFYVGQPQQPFWTPQDYGTARMASFGWMMLLARNESKEEEFLKERRSFAEKAESQRDLFDAYYLASLTNNPKDSYLALKKLSSRPDADLSTKTMYLSSLAGRAFDDGQANVIAVQVNQNASSDEDELPLPNLPPLDKDELEHVLACYRDVRNSPDDGTSMMYFGQSFTQVIAMELKRSGRKDEADKMMKEALDAAKDPAQIASELAVAVQRGKYDVAIQLLDRIAELKPDANSNQTQNTGNAFNYVQYLTSPAYQAQLLAQLMDKRAQKKELKDVLSLWNRYLVIAAANRDQQSTANSSVKRRIQQQQYQNQPQGYVHIWKGNNMQYEQIDFPAANEIYDQTSIMVLRQAFVIYRDAEATRDLVQHFKNTLADTTTPESQKLFWQLGLGYLNWWVEDKEEALSVLTAAADSLVDNQDLKLELARLHEKRREYAEALEIVDSLAAADQQTMQKREMIALRMAVNSGNIDRARTAAERLFGLRLDSSLQIQLAQQMYQLGMHEQAEAILARAGRQAGNRTDVLASLMQQYQSQGKNDVATQIAHQLLRRSGSSSTVVGAAGRRVVMQQNDNGGLRQQAMAVLKRSGKLPEMIAKVESQLKNSPKSQRLIEMLIEYYTAIGDTKKVAEITARISETKQDDPQFRYNLAQQLFQQGKHAEAVEHYKAAIKKDPKVMQNNLWQVMNSFQSANKMDEFGALIEEIDMKSFRQNPWEISNLISNMSHDDKTKDRAVAIFKRAWKDLPDQRQQLLQSARTDVFWQMPEIYEYARQGIIPTETTVLQNNGWNGFGQIQSYSGDGKVITMLSRFLTIAATNKKLDELAREVEEAQKKVPKWDGGKVLLAMIDLKRGKIDEAKVQLEKMLATVNGKQGNAYVQWEIGQELMSNDKCVDLAIQYFEQACKDQNTTNMNGYQYSPAKPLVSLYKQKGRTSDARRLLVEASKAKSTRNGNNADYEAYQRIQNAQGLGTEMVTMGFPVDALRMYQDQLAREEDFAGLSRVYGGGTQGSTQADRMKKQLETGFQNALKQLTPELLPDLLSGAASTKKTLDDDASADSVTSIDLLLLLDSRDLNKTQISSAIGRLVTGIAAKPDMIEKTKAALADLHSKHPEDFSSLILAMQLAQSTSEVDNVNSIVRQLVELIEKTPLEPQPSKGGFTAKQRDAAMQQTALWLVARDCLKQESLRKEGKKIGERALEASRRQLDNGFALAILKEWGQLAIESGDKTTAEERWTEMLEIIIPKPVEKGKKADESKTSWKTPAPQSPLKENGKIRTGRILSKWEVLLAPSLIGQIKLTAPAAPGQAAPSASKTNAIMVTQFEQATQIAKLAAENGLKELSVKAMMMALQSGPPIEPMEAIDINRQAINVRNNNNNEPSQLAQKVEERLAEIEMVWRRIGISDEVVYELLKTAVLPDSRPFEVFPYPRPLHLNPSQPPQSVGSLLVKAAIKVGKVDEIKQLIQPRLKQPLGELAGRVVLAQLALATQDKQLANEQIQSLTNRLQQDTLQYSSELACHIAIPASNLSDLRLSSAELLERALGHLSQNITQNQRGNIQEEPIRSLRFKLARIHFENNVPDAGKRQLEEYLSFLVPLYSRYGGDYGLYRQRIELMKVAAEYARAGLRAEALDCLGRHADLQVSRNYGQENSGRATATILAGLGSIPAAERFTLLKSWTLPTADRKSVRMIGGLVPGDNSPTGFDVLRGQAPRTPHNAQLMSTAELLVTAAAETNQLDGLQKELLSHAEQNVENANLLLLMTRIARGEGAEAVPALQKFLEERKASSVPQNNYQSPAQINDLVLARMATANNTFRATGRELATQFIAHVSRSHDHLAVAAGRREYYSPVIEPGVVDRMNNEPWNTGLKHWTAGAVASASTESSGALPMWWIAQENMVSHICGPDASHLYLKYPLIGEFSFTADCWFSSAGESNVGYGGIIFNGLHLGSNSRIASVGNRNDAAQKSDPPEIADRYNRVRLDVTRDKIRYFVNNTFIHEEPQSESSSPWLFVHCERIWHTAVRNLQFTGQPEIPRQVALVQKSSLLGWVTDFYGESQPNREATRGGAAVQSQDFDWSAEEGIIRGRQQSVSGLGNSMVQQSRLYYDRPILDGEVIAYEFWYEPGFGGSHVAPAVDRLAFLLEADGVKLHWMTDGSAPEDAYGGLPADNVLVDPTIQRGKVSLKERDWNSVIVSLNEGNVTLTLNSAIVAVKKLERDNRRQFGFFHDKNSTSVKVRNVILSGDWPKSLSTEIASNLFAPTRERTTEERRGNGAAIDEKFFVTDFDSLVLKTRTMPLEEQYEALKSWVLPNVDHGTFRMYGAFTPNSTSVPPDRLMAARIEIDNGKAKIRRQTLGGELYAPALDLVYVAKKLNRLDELATLVDPTSEDNTLGARSKVAMQVLIDMSKGDQPKVVEGLTKLLALCKLINSGAPINDRWQELVVADEVMKYPQYRAFVLPVLTQVVENKNQAGLGSAWEARVNSMRDHCKLLIDSDELPLAGASSPRGQWSPVNVEWADANSRGPVSRWQFRNQEIGHVAGDSHDYLYFQSPLRGKFNIESEIATHGWRETRLMYHALWVGPQHPQTMVEIGNLTSSWQGPKIEPRLEYGDWCQLKLSVEPNKATYFIGDRQVHEHALPDQPDPWLALMTQGIFSGGARSVRITGQPEIPEEIQLSSRPDLTGWMANLYFDPMGTNDTAAWIKSENEIVGRKFESEAGRKRQSLLRYHRPLFDDSVIRYDFFYGPGQTGIHPTLGRMAFLLEPDGVKEHWLTDVQWDHSGMTPGNATVEKSHQRGPSSLPLKRDDWNHIQLAVTGDVMKLILNDVEIYEWPVPMTNQRQFGLFHFADETDVRVKNVVYRGDWPKILPGLKDQEFSGLGTRPFDFKEGELKVVLSWDFQEKKPAFMNEWGIIKKNRMEPVAGGMKVVHGEKAPEEGNLCGFIWNTDVKGDFEATLKYRDFESKTDQQDWQVPRLELQFDIGGGWGDPNNANILQGGLRRQSDGKLVLFGANRIRVGDDFQWKHSYDTTTEPSGQFRFVRKGKMAYYLHSKLEPEEWSLLFSGDVSEATLTGGNLGLRTELPTSSGEIVLTEFILKTKESP